MSVAHKSIAREALMMARILCAPQPSDHLQLQMNGWGG